MRRRDSFAVLAGAPFVLPVPAAGTLRLAAFRADATPPAGEPLIWVDPIREVLDPLWAKGVVLDDGRSRVVLCAVDWCGIGGSTHTLFRRRIAEAAGTEPSHVAVQSVHQHTAPYVDGDAYAVLDELPNPPLRMSAKALDLITGRISRAVTGAVRRMQPVDAVGLGMAEVEQVASARRIVRESGGVIIRFSTAAKDANMSALPEGNIDRTLRTVTFARGRKPVVCLHYYATHPQTFCCDGRVSADFVGAAREEWEKTEGIPQIYFTGCGGDVTVGKYNDSSRRAYEGLKARLLAALRASSQAVRWSDASGMKWTVAPLRLAPRATPPPDVHGMEERPAADLYRSAISVAFARRERPLEVSALDLGAALILHLPGEPMLAFSRYAQQVATAGTAIVAGYGDISPGYICTDEAFGQGGYEPSAANSGPGTEAQLKQVIKNLVAG